MHREISEEYRHTPDKTQDRKDYEQQIKADPTNAKFSKSLPTDFAWTYCCAAMCPESRGYPILLEIVGREDPKRPEAQPRHLPWSPYRMERRDLR
eukprot:2888191-Heterocapsa_arctica.AAC.1